MSPEPTLTDREEKKLKCYTFTYDDGRDKEGAMVFASSRKEAKQLFSNIGWIAGTFETRRDYVSSDLYKIKYDKKKEVPDGAYKGEVPQSYYKKYGRVEK